jgi:L-iditol 2-dehydrogenase
MKAAMHVAPGVMECRDVPEPVPGPGEIKIRVEYAGICGTDVEVILDHLRVPKSSSWTNGPMIEGHEACGSIVELGPGVRQDFKVGQRVGLGFRAGCGVCYYCRNGLETLCEFEQTTSGTWAQYALFPEGAVFPLPDDVPLELAALVEPLSIAVHLVDVTSVRSGQSLLISGGGTIGLLSLAVALKAGASTVLVSEPKQAKREIALRMGAHAVVDPLAEGGQGLAREVSRLTAGRGFRTALEVSGNLRAAESMLDLLDRGGTLVWGAVYDNGARIGVPPFTMFAKELTIKGGFLAPYSLYRAISLLTELDLAEIVTDIYPLDQVQAAFDNHLAGNGVKTLLKCW